MRILRANARVSLLSVALLVPVLAGHARGQSDDGWPGTEVASESVIRDEAGLFDPGYLRSAEGILKVYDQVIGLPILIETIENLEGRSIDDVTLERAGESGREGLYLLIAAKEREFSLIVSRAYQKQVDEQTRNAIRDALVVEFRKGDFDAGLARGLMRLGLIVRKDSRQAARDNASDQDELADAVVDPEATPFRNVGTSRPLVSRDHIRLSLGGAETILRHAQDQARSMDLKVNIAVVDDGGHLVAFVRMDGARPGSGNTALTKAVAAATFRMPTGPIPPGTASPDPILNIGLTLTAMAGGGRSTPLYGGVPIEVEGQVIGAVGVGGATGEQDAEIARAGIAALVKALEERAKAAP